jgi:hypothetical protein
VDDLELAKQAEAEEPESKKTSEMALYHAYKKDPGPHTFQPLYRSFKPFIIKAARGNMIGSIIPQSAHTARAAQSFYDALHTFDEKKGKLHSYVYDAVREKGKRLNYKYQNIGYIPEARASKYQLYKNTVHMLKEGLGREPSTSEVADELKWSPKMVETLRKEIRSDLVLDEMRAENHPFARSDKMMEMFHDLHPNLLPTHQLVLEHAQGMFGKPMLTKPSGGPDVAAISLATKISAPKIRSALKTITRKAKEYMGEHIIESELGLEGDGGEEGHGV